MPRNSRLPRLPCRPLLLWTGILLVGVGDLLLGSPLASAQRTRHSFTIGAQVGQPAGVTAKLYRSSQRAYEGLVTTDGDDVATLYLHRLHERALPDSLLHLYLGPGVFAGSQDLSDLPSPRAGLSGVVGLNFYAERFEVFLQVTPRVRLFPNPHPTLGGSVGLRYLLRQP